MRSIYSQCTLSQTYFPFDGGVFLRSAVSFNRQAQGCRICFFRNQTARIWFHKKNLVPQTRLVLWVVPGQFQFFLNKSHYILVILRKKNEKTIFYEIFQSAINCLTYPEKATIKRKTKQTLRFQVVSPAILNHQKIIQNDCTYL